MTNWDVPSPGSWDDPYGDPHSHRDEASPNGAGAGRHAAGDYDHEDGTFNGFTPRGRRSGDGGYAHPARPVSPARPSGRPVSPARPPSSASYQAPGAGYEAPGYQAPGHQAPGYEAPGYQAPMGQSDAWNLPPQPLPNLPQRPVSPPPQRPVSPARSIAPRPAPVSPPAFQGPAAFQGPPAFQGPYSSAPNSGGGGYGSGGGYGGGGGGRSHWVDESGVDSRGRLIIDPDDIDLDEETDDSGLNRRRALLALGGVVAGTAAVLSPPGLNLVHKLFGGPAKTAPDALSHDHLPGDGSDRPAGKQPSNARTYTDQNESYMGSSAGDQVRKNTPKVGTVAKAGPAQAAVTAALPTADPVVVSALGTDPIRHLASRLTFGPTPAVIAEITRVGIDQWVGTQLSPETISDAKLDAKLAELTTVNQTVDQLRANRDANGQKGIAPDQETVEATIARMIWSERQLFEVMVDFWNDFLHVAAFFDGAEIQRPAFDRDVIRKYALDNYPDMFVAANRNAALMNYLDQDQSNKNAVNENLARENLELYTVGVDGGYTEVDVRQAALLQTGRSIRDDKYVYRPDQHFVGPIKILGFTTPNDTAAGGEAAAEAYFRYLALHPSTARYVAQSLAVRLVSDTPPAALVDKVAATYLANQGQIKPTLTTLLSSTEFWGSVGQKVRRPMEYLVATYRTLGMQPDTPATFNNTNANASGFLQGLRQIRGKMEEMGQFPTGQPTPNGYPDVFVAWTSAGTMINGWNEAYNVLSGSRPMFTYVAPEQLLGTTPPTTAGAYVDALAMRLVHQPLTPAQRDLIISVANTSATSNVTAATTVDPSFNGAIKAVARTILASPQHHLR
jgi:uncharacterized protein (DUF1800 family)